MDRWCHDRRRETIGSSSTACRRCTQERGPRQVVSLAGACLTLPALRSLAPLPSLVRTRTAPSPSPARSGQSDPRRRRDRKRKCLIDFMPETAGEQYAPLHRDIHGSKSQVCHGNPEDACERNQRQSKPLPRADARAWAAVLRATLRW